MAEIAITRTTAEWEELLLRIDVPHAAFAKITEIAEQPHLKAVGMIATLDHPSEGKIRQARPSARFSDTPAEIHCMPPRLGEHSRAILREAGFTEEDVASMIEKKVVGTSS
jgi:crotonobetainyl-CoA:carnitine CoA-transferase CaiB-like acyl-CoA transferase